MSHFLEKLGNSLGSLMEKMDRQKHFSAVKDGITISIPLTIIGAIATLLANPPIPSTLDMNSFVGKLMSGWQAFATSSSGVLNLISSLTMGSLSLFVVISITYILAGKYKMNRLNAIICSLISFLIVAAPFTTIESTKVIPVSYLDAKGLFTAILVALISVELTRFLLNHNVKIKMPDSVPPMIAGQFESLIPIVVNILFWWLISWGIQSAAGVLLPQFILDLLKPLIAVSNSWVMVVVIGLFINGFWLFGLHGGNIVGAVINPFLLMNLNENIAAYEAGAEIPNILVSNFHVMFMNFGGAPAALAILIAILVASKSAHQRSIAKAAIVPSMFNISEPVIFGLPIVLNPILAIPVLIVPILNGLVFYFLMYYHVLGRMVLSIPWTIPGFIGGAIATLDWKVAVLWFVLLAVDVLLFIPFIKMYDKKLEKSE